MEADSAVRAVFERIDREAAVAIGQRLFTATAFDAATMEVRRVYSSNPAVYPVGGLKPKRDTEFGRRVLVDGQPLVCEGDEAIARVFDDHETIRGLGLHSSINVPVVNAARIVGVLNLLFSAERISSDQLRAASRSATDSDVIAALATDLSGVD
jgi:hypothetical protein